jgi:hypothetical protein
LESSRKRIIAQSGLKPVANYFVVSLWLKIICGHAEAWEKDKESGLKSLAHSWITAL